MIFAHDATSSRQRHPPPLLCWKQITSSTTADLRGCNWTDLRWEDTSGVSATCYDVATEPFKSPGVLTWSKIWSHLELKNL